MGDGEIGGRGARERGDRTSAVRMVGTDFGPRKYLKPKSHKWAFETKLRSGDR